MKALQFIALNFIFILIANASGAQKLKTEIFDVSGNCGMCKKTIEKAAKDAGATTAEWNAENKKITVKFAKGTDLAKIQKKIAEVGYDNEGAIATEAAYYKLHGCCQYDRTIKEVHSSKE